MVGIGDLQESAAIKKTLHGYSDYEETKKWDLEQPDIRRIEKLYGE